MNTSPASKPLRADPLEPSRGRVDPGRIRATSEAEIAASSPPELQDLPHDFWNDAAVVRRRQFRRATCQSGARSSKYAQSAS